MKQKRTFPDNIYLATNIFIQGSCRIQDDPTIYSSYNTGEYMPVGAHGDKYRPRIIYRTTVLPSGGKHKYFVYDYLGVITQYSWHVVTEDDDDFDSLNIADKIGVFRDSSFGKIRLIKIPLSIRM